MGFAAEHLSEARLIEIARSLIHVTGEDKTKGELHGLCPLPGHREKHPSFSYNYLSDVFHCFACGAGGDLVALYAEIHGLDNKAALKAFCEEYSIVDESGPGKAAQGRQDGRQRPRKTNPAPKDRIIPDNEYEALRPLPADWLARLQEKRGWSAEIIDRFGLRLWEKSRGDRTERRVAIPVRNDRGELVNIRLYKPGSADKNKVISWGKGFGAGRLFPSPSEWGRDEKIWLCEGEPDTLCALSRGLNAVTATTGASTWKPDYSQAFKDRDVVIAYDADEPGRAGAIKAARSIAKHARLVRIIAWPEFMSKGQDLTDWFVTHGKTVGDLAELLSKAQVVEAPAAVDPAGPARFWSVGINGRGLQFKPALLADEILRDHDLVTDPETKLTYRWTGRFWETISQERLEQLATAKLGTEATSARAADAATLAVRRALLPHGETMNCRPELICLENGMFNVETGELLPHDKAHRATFMLPISFDPRTPRDCPRWKSFLAETVQDEAVVDELQEFFGYCLTRNTWYGKALILIGPGEDGKSKCLDILQALVGEENCSNVDMGYLDNEFHRATLYNKALNVYTEIDTKMLSTGYFKAIVTGDRIDAAYKHKDAFQFRPFCKLAFSTNQMPRVTDTSHGFFRRLLMVRFRKQFTGDQADPRIIEKLKAELPGIFGWSWVGLRRLLKRDRFEVSTETRRLLESYRLDNNPVLGFVQEACTTEPEFGGEPEIRKDDLYKAYREWTQNNGFGAFNKSRFAQELLAAVPGLREVKRRSGDDRIRYWAGLRLAEPPDPLGSSGQDKEEPPF